MKRPKAEQPENKQPQITEPSSADLAEIPELTDAEMARARPFAEVFPELAASITRARGPQRKPTKVRVSLRVDRDVLDHFKRDGDGYQGRMNAALRKAAGV